MIRKAYVQRCVLELYQMMPSIQYPIRPNEALPYLPKNSRILSYQEMAESVGTTPDELMAAFQSDSGSTHYEEDSNRCLILYNKDMCSGRILWTIAHEFGHICLGHIQYSERVGGDRYEQFEKEADYFAWNLLAPFPIMRERDIQNHVQIQEQFGLSAQAAKIHLERFEEWKRSHIKTAWENNLVRLFHVKSPVINDEDDNELEAAI